MPLRSLKPGTDNGSQMNRYIRLASVFLPLAVAVFAIALHSAVATAADDPKTDLPRISPEELIKTLKYSTGDKPAMFQVGFRVLYAQAHIPGSEYVGAASTDSGLKQLQQRVEALPKNRFIVLYCGCCPWIHCPNVKPAYEKLHALGFTNVKVLYIAENFGTDWVDKGYPVAKGE
jgi:thiosulfate/3-mercaptopyruvate sulfurtransferase